MSAMRLLELQKQFNNYDEDGATLAEFGMKPERSREDIAQEYEQCLRNLLTS